MEKFNKNILVTGGYGFIGSNFLNMMVPLFPEYLFVNMDNRTHGSDILNIKDHVKNAKNYKETDPSRSDISNNDHVNEAFASFDITDVIHFAAETHVDRSIKYSNLFLSTNIFGTKNLLDAFIRWNCLEGGRFLHVSTDEVYGESTDSRDRNSFNEADPVEPRNIYSATKAAAEHIVVAYGNVYDLDYIITRAGNNYGENQDDSKFIPKMIKLALKDEPLPIYGNGTNFRQWTHVDDHVNGIMMAFNRGLIRNIYNFAGDDKLTNNEIVDIILKLTKSKSKIIYVDDRPAHDFGYSVDCKKALQHLSWKQSIDFSHGIKTLISKYTKKQ